MNTVQYTKMLIGLTSMRLGHTSLAKETFLKKHMTNQPLASNEKEIDELSSFSSFSSMLKICKP